jgi:polyisoprenoid-binding protein YceI
MKTHNAALLLSLGLLSLPGCKNPASDAPKAAVSEAAPAAAEAPPASHERLAISSAESKVRFVGSKVTGSHDGGFERFTGTLHLDARRLEASRLEVDIDMNSVWADNERLTGHLKSGDFFLVSEHPAARFVSTSITPGGEGGSTHTIVGNLTLRGVTRAVTFPATVEVGPDAVRARSEFALPRKQFGVAYEGKQDDLIRDEVLVKLDVVAPRQGTEAAR